MQVQRPASSSMLKLQSVEAALLLEDQVDDMELSRLLLRAAPARMVAAAWSDLRLENCRQFWESNVGRKEDYLLSRDATSVDVFCSHSWGAPPNWEEVMGSSVNYADVKSTLLSVIAKDIAVLEHGGLSAWDQVTFWVDKACIPQDIAQLKDLCINMLDKFIHHSTYVCVLFTWSYLERLWCVYEWACILVEKDLRKVYIMNENLVTEKTLLLYIASIRNFSLANTKCFVESDRAILRAKIDKCYTSAQDFEKMVQAAAIALMARSMAFRAGRSARLYEQFYMPFIELADELGFEDLGLALRTCNLDRWRTLAMSANGSPTTTKQPDIVSSTSTTKVSSTKYVQKINDWFDRAVSPVLIDMRKIVEILNI